MASTLWHERNYDRLVADGALQSIEVVKNRVYAEAQTCPYCQKPVHPDNWDKHMKMYHRVQTNVKGFPMDTIDTSTKSLTVLDPVRTSPIVSRSVLSMSVTQITRIKSIASLVANSQLAYGKQRLQEGDVFLIILKGVELGLEPMAALDSIDIINGMPCLDAQGMLALINQRGELADIQIMPGEGQCTVMMKRNGRSPHTETFTLQDAEDQGLMNKPNWKKMENIMLKWRAIAACARVVFPDVIQGLYTGEELGATVDEDGKPVDDSSLMPEPGKIENNDKPNWNMDALTNATAFLYDGNVHEQNNSLKKHTTGNDALIQLGDSLDLAVAKLIGYKAEQKFGLNSDGIKAALDTDYKAFLAAGHTPAEAWDIIKMAGELEQGYTEATTAPERETETEDETDIPF